jgi:hypothetical protein
MKRLLTISLTNKCDRSCPYCPVKEYMNNPAYEDSLTLEPLCGFIESAKPTNIEITGGEPTLVGWLADLLDFIESKGIDFLVKSNGHKRCKNQITAWHGSISEPPSNYDKMLIIGGTPEWERKMEWCLEKGIPYAVLPKDGYRQREDGSLFQAMLECPDGRIKRCSSAELKGEKKYIFSGFEPCLWTNQQCIECPSVNNHVCFLAGIY